MGGCMGGTGRGRARRGDVGVKPTGRAQQRPSRGSCAPRALSLLATYSYHYMPHLSERSARCRCPEPRAWSRETASLARDRAWPTAADCSDGQRRCRCDLERSSTRVSERVLPQELGNGSTHAYEGSRAHGGRARSGVRIGWPHLLCVVEKAAPGFQKAPESTLQRLRL